MAKYVIAGKLDCPFYARAEILADELKLRLSDFAVHKIVVKSEEWDNWLEKICREKGWNYQGESPIIWRELINRGGKGLLVGSCNEFLEIAKGYYGITCLKSTNKLEKIANENAETKIALDEEVETRKRENNPLKITILNADNDVIYNVIPLIMKSETVTSQNCYRSISLNFHTNDRENYEEKLNALVLEVEDCSFCCLSEVKCDWDLQSVLASSELVIIPNSIDVIDLSVLTHWKNYASAIESMAKHEAKIIVFGNHATTACYIISQFCSKIPPENFYAVSRLDENKVKSALAKKLEVLTAGISDVIVWGPSQQGIIDHSMGIAHGYNGAIWAPHVKGFSHNINEKIYDKAWLSDELPDVLHVTGNKNDAEIRDNISLAAAFCTQLQDIMNPSKSGLFSLGLISKGWYGVPQNLVFSFPVKYENDSVNIVDNLPISSELRENIMTTAANYQKTLDEYMEKLCE